MIKRFNQRGEIGLLIVVFTGLLISLIALNPNAAGRPFGAFLSGFEEVPGPGDEDGFGLAAVTLNQAREQVCFRIEVSEIMLPAIGAHIHVAPARIAGPVVVPLDPPDASGVSMGCVGGVSKALIKAILLHPEEYYVNVHTADFPAGAVRGQLIK